MVNKIPPGGGGKPYPASGLLGVPISYVITLGAECNAKCNNALCNTHSLLHLAWYYIRGCDLLHYVIKDSWTILSLLH